MFNTAVTLICNPKFPIISETLRRDAIACLKPWASGDIRHDTLAEDLAHDFLFNTDQDLAGAHAALTDLIGSSPIDCVIQGAENRRKKLLIADMDSTIIEQECIDELAAFAGKRDEISAITERAMRGELDFEAALKERVAMLKGVPETALQETFEKHITLTPGARALVQTMNGMGAVTALVSGGFTFFTDRVGAAAGFQKMQANILQTSDGALAGEVQDPILGRTAKQQALVQYAADHGVSHDETLAVGDGANDLSMLESAGLGVAFRAKPAVAQAANARIDHGDLTALLYLQGVKMAEFAVN